MVNTFSLPLSTIIFIQNGHDVKSVWLGCQRADKGWLAEQRYRTNCQQQTKCYFDGVKRPNYKEREWRKKKKKQRYPSIVWSSECLLRELWREKD